MNDTEKTTGATSDMRVAGPREPLNDTVAANRRTVRRRRGRALAVAGLIVLAGGAAAVAAVGFGGGSTDTPAATDLPPATAQVTRQTMLDTDEIPGVLGYSATTTLAGRIAGVVTKVPLPGDVIRRGRPIYRVDNRPVVLMYGAVAAYRTLGPYATGTDVRQLETNLKALGYGGFTVDRTYTAATATAVRRWQKDLRMPQTGQVEQGRVLFAPGPIRVDAVTAGVNQSTGGGQEVLRYTGTGRQVTVRLEVAKQRLARRGVRVRIEMPDGTKVAGRVKRVYTVIEQQTTPDDQAETMLEAIVSLNDPRAARGIETAVVNVVFTAAEHENGLTVPVAALVALAEGGYGVEVVQGSTTHYVKVKTGLFANGRVEVTGDGLTDGMTVGMPR
ncbi:peptidoglycan-binding protein [Microbispora sp. RL4-1S]|uniref:Peptidoglycan-binding protein n=1 Tax=Microbispora oryzae TaxID=2806554 RepID=A0A940WRF6_9ACTN|nr:peptidoglycan-binding protein [Microbispora oryzae]MBP2706110.1 peptidoglycan-binding protein [Microbispora oryzae]